MGFVFQTTNGCASARENSLESEFSRKTSVKKKLSPQEEPSQKNAAAAVFVRPHKNLEYFFLENKHLKNLNRILQSAKEALETKGLQQQKKIQQLEREVGGLKEALSSHQKSIFLLTKEVERLRPLSEPLHAEALQKKIEILQEEVLIAWQNERIERIQKLVFMAAFWMWIIWNS